MSRDQESWFIRFHEATPRDPRPRIILLGKSGSREAEKIANTLNEDYPRGFGLIEVDGLELTEQPRQDKAPSQPGRANSRIIASYPFLGEPHDTP